MAIQINGSTGVSGVNGTGANPVYSGGDSDTGIFFPALGQVAITTNGVQRLLIAETGDIQSASVLSFPGGSASAPSIAFTGDTDTGLYSPSANSVAISTGGSGRLFVDANGNVGVGAAPVVVFAGQTHLTVNHSSGGTTVAGINLATDGTRRASLITYPSNSEALRITAESTTLPITVHTNGSERLRITSAGLVGIGTSSPGRNLHVAGSSATALIESTGSTNADLLIGDGGVRYYGIRGVAGGGSLQIRNDTANTTLATFTSTGLVGIGTTTPQTTLDCNGNIRVPNNTFYQSSDGSGGWVELIKADSSNNTAIANNKNLAITFATGGAVAERARIDSSGRLLVGTSSASVFTYGGITPRLQVEGTDGNTGALSIARNSNDANAPGLIISKSRGTTAGSNTIVQNNDTVGDLRFEAADGTQKAIAASIACMVDGTPGANDMPGRLVFSTTADGASFPTERLRITSAGLVGVGTSSPAEALDVVGKARVISNTGATNTGDQNVVVVGATTSGAFSSTYGAGLQFQITNSNGGYSGSRIVSRLNADNNTANLVFQSRNYGFSDAMTLDSSGRLGIGTIGPEDRLDLGSGYLRFKEAIGGTGTYGAIRAFNTLANTNPATSIRFIRDVANVGNDGAICFDTVNSERARIDSSGSFGIGTSSPNGRLDVADGDAYITKNSGGDASGVTSQSLYIRTQSGNLARLYSVSQGSGGPGGFGGDFRIQTKADNGALADRFTINYLGSVGIGTTSPSGKTEIVSSGSESTLILRNSSSTAYTYSELKFAPFTGTTAAAAAIRAEYYQDNNSSLAFRTTNTNAEPTTKMFIDQIGRVGIGTTSPAQLLHLKGSGDTKLLLNSANNASDRGIYFATSTDSEVLGYIKQEYSTGQLQISSGTGSYASDVAFRTAGFERAKIDISGRLLVGTSTGPSDSTLVLQGNSSNSTYNSVLRMLRNVTNPAADAVLGSIIFGVGNAASSGIECYTDGQWGTNDYPGRLVFSTTADGASSPTERMRIGQNGYIQCSETGTYSPDGGSVWHKFYQSVNERCLQTYNTTGTFTNYAFTQYIAAGGSTGSGFASGFSDSGSIQRYIIFSNGNIQNTNNSYGAISDLKLKENIVDASEQWNDIKNLRVRKYNLKQGGAHTQIGVIAQEIELVSPGLVYETTDRDTDGNDLGTVTKSVNYSVLYMKAVKALQEAMERIETLEAENAHQKASLTDILSRISALEGA